MKAMTTSAWKYLLLLLAASWPLFAQTTSVTPVPLAPVITSPMPDPTVAVPTSLDPDLVVPAAADNYQIGAGDLLSVFIYQMPGLTRQVRVSQDGTISLPLLPQRLPAADLTSPQLAAEIRQALLTRQLARNPIVQVIVREVDSRPIVVAGAVRYPGVVEANRPMSLLEVISRAGGLAADAGTTVLLTTPGDHGPRTQSLNLGDVTEAAGGPANPVLRGGESVRVVPARMVYAVGSLQKPGAFPLRSGEPLTVLKAVALAQGIKAPANEKHAIIFRIVEGVSTPIPVNLNNVLKHKAPDIPLQAGDIFFLPESGRGKLFSATGSVAVQAAAIAIGYTLVR